MQHKNKSADVLRLKKDAGKNYFKPEFFFVGSKSFKSSVFSKFFMEKHVPSPARLKDFSSLKNNMNAP